MDIKREQILSRLDQRNKEREIGLEIQKQNKDWSKSQNVQNFDRQFETTRDKIMELLKICDDYSDGDKINLAQTFDEINCLMQKLQKLMAESAPTLPSYDMRKGQNNLNELTLRFSNVQNKNQPKKQFAFSTRKKIGNVKDVDFISSGKSQRKSNENCASIDRVDGIEEDTQTKNGIITKQDDAKMFSAKSLKNTAINFGQECNSSDVVLADLNGCTVKISGCPSTLYVNKLEHCTIISLPISTSVFVENCQNVEFSLACQQLRVHSSISCDFYLHVTSKAIIEDCSKLRFAPYSFIAAEDGELKRIFDKAGLDYERNNWNNVDDFNWPIKTTPSPNWHTIVESERKTFSL